jgi:hypothetical protein
MSDEELDILFRNAAEKIEIEFEVSSWVILKEMLEKTNILDDIEPASVAKVS